MTLPRFHLFAVVIVLLGACTHTPTEPVTDEATESVREPLVTENPDGAITVQRESDGDKQGLVIKPQVVTPDLPRRRE